MSDGKLVFTIVSTIAEFEREVIRERTRAGLDAARARGRAGGRPPALSDRDRTLRGLLLRYPESTAVAVAARLNVAASTFYRHLPGGHGALARGEP